MWQNIGTKVTFVAFDQMRYWRYVFSLLCFIGLVLLYALRSNLSIAILAMTNPPTPGNSQPQKSSYDWDVKTQGQILGSFFYGYILTQILGGYVATRFSAKHTFGFGVFLTGSLSLLTKVFSDVSSLLLCILRVLEGATQGITFPAMHALLSRWTPSTEKNQLVTFIYAGAPMGNVISFPLSGYLAENGPFGGWPSIFYLMGMASFVWFFVWLFLVFDTPSQHPFISIEERNYIETYCDEDIDQQVFFSKNLLMKIFQSTAFWAIVVSHFSFNWGLYSMITVMPLYLAQVHGMSAQSSGFYSFLPYFIQLISMVSCGKFANFLILNNLCKVKFVRKLFNTLGLLAPAFFILVTAFTKNQAKLAISFLSIAFAFSGAAYSGYFINHFDIAPRYAGFLFGLTNTFATIPGFLGPIIATALTHEDPDALHWFNVFAILSLVLTAGSIFFLVFGSSEKENWAYDSLDNSDYSKIS